MKQLMFLTFVAFLFITHLPSAYGQRLKFTFSYGQQTFFNNYITVKYYALIDGEAQVLTNQNEPSIDAKGSKAITLVLSLTNFELDEQLKNEEDHLSIILPPEAINIPEGLEKTSQAGLYLNQRNRKIEVRYRVQKNSEGFIDLPLGIHDNLKADNPFVPVKSIRRKFNIFNFNPSQAYASAHSGASLDRLIQEKDLDQLRQFLKDQPKHEKVSEVKAVIRKIEEEDWRAVSQTNTPIAYQSYIDRFPNGKYKRPARKKIKELEAALVAAEEELPQKWSKEKAYWKRVKEKDQPDLYISYLSRFEDGQYTEEALQALNRLLDIKPGITKLDDGKTYLISLENTKNPRLNTGALSTAELKKLTDNVTIDSSQLASNNQLKVTTSLLTSFTIPIIDDYGKTVEINLENILQATLEKIGEDHYKLFIKDGFPPYGIEFIAKGSSFPSARLGKIIGNEFQLTRETFKKYNLNGTYKIKVWDAKRLNFVSFDEFIEIDNSKFIPPYLWVIIIFGIVFIVWRIIMVRLRNPKTVFDS